jgi:hypothetical protein
VVTALLAGIIFVAIGLMARIGDQAAASDRFPTYAVIKAGKPAAYSSSGVTLVR